MRVFISVFILVFSFKSFSQGSKFEIKFSEPMAVFIYVERLSARQGDNSFKKKFQASSFYTEKYRTLLRQFDSLRINYTYDFDQYPFSSKIPGMTEGLLKKCLVGSANLKDFKRKAIGIIPNADLLQLSAILYDFQQVYRELVYQPVKARFEKQLNEVTDFVKTKNISSFIDKGLLFYKSYWEESFPFDIAFYPQPYPGGFSAEAFYNTAVSGLKSDSKDYITLVSVMLHEIFHMLYDEQPVSVKNNISNWFSANPSNCSTYAYLLLNEALATALGNGYVFNSLAGKVDEDDWYDRKYTNDLAKKIYPLVVDYINQKKSIDAAFVNSYIKIYDENFSGWINELDNLMCYRYVISDNMSDYDVIQNKYRYASYSQFEDQVTENSLGKLKNTKLTKVVIVSKENETKLALVKKTFPELKTWKYKAKQEFFYSVPLGDKTQLIVINIVKSTTEKMLEGMVLLPQRVEKK